jgi:hypothetical protein
MTWLLQGSLWTKVFGGALHTETDETGWVGVLSHPNCIAGVPYLPYISLLLICLLLSAMWTQQMTISSVIICTTAVSILTYASTIVVSILRPVSLFQIPRAELMGDILEHVHTYRWGSFLMVRPLNYLPSAAY